MSSEDEGVWRRLWLFHLKKERAPNTHPSHHLLKTDQLLLRPRHGHLLGDCRTVKSLHEVVRDPPRFKSTQACDVCGVSKECKLLSPVNAFHAPEYLLHAVNCTYMSNPRLCKRSQILNVAFDQAFYCNLQLVVRFKSIFLPVARMMLDCVNILQVSV